MTENHNLNTPAQGTTDWHTPLNENFQQLDGRLPVVDFEANTGQYTPVKGAIFVAKDTGARFVGDGSQWTSLAYPTETTNDTTDSTSGTTIADFETTDLSAWRGNTGAIQFSSLSLSGSQSVTNGSGDTDIYSLPGDGLGNYFPKGSTATWLVNTGSPDGSENVKAAFGVGDGDNMFRFSFLTGKGAWNVRRVVSGNYPGDNVAWGEVNPSADTWYEMTVVRDDGTLGGNDNDITVKLLEDPTGSQTTLVDHTFNDSTHASNAGVGVSFGNTASPTPVVDEIKLR